jgi:hypothetical protein
MPHRRGNNGPGTVTELQDAATRVLDSATFSRSPRLRDFLSFVVKCSVEDRGHEVNEYSIGLQVFGKHPDYNPNLDNIVRVTARQLRLKLTDYYSNEGSLDHWRITIPKGCYEPTLISDPPVESVKDIQPSSIGHRSAWILGALSVLCAAGWGAAAWLQFHMPRDLSQPAYLLAPILTDRALPATIVLDDPVLGAALWRIGGETSINDFVNRRYMDSKYFSTDENRLLLGMLKRNYFVDFLSLQTMQKLASVAHSNRVESAVIDCRALKPEQMKKGNFIFIGGIVSNPWVGEAQRNLAFEHIIDRIGGRRIFVNRSPKAGEPGVFETPDNNPDEQYYTRIAVLRNPYGAGKIALLGGTSRDATEAAGQFALSQTGVDQLRRLCGVPVEKLAGFELILATQSLAGAPLSQHVVAGRCSQQ